MRRTGVAGPPGEMETTLLKGLVVLEALAVSREPRGVTEFAHELGLQKSNVHRLLQTLAAAGFVRQDPESGRYQCTLKLFELGTLIADRLDVVTVARPHIAALAHRTAETVHLSVLDGAEVVYVDKIDSPQPVRAYSRVGGRAPAYGVATGKALLAFSSAFPASLVDITARLHAHTPRTLTEPDALERELLRARTKGFAVNRGEWRESVGGIAAPIFGRSPDPVAAVGISGPIARLTATRMRDFAPHVVATANAISRALGGGVRLAVSEGLSPSPALS